MKILTSSLYFLFQKIEQKHSILKLTLVTQIQNQTKQNKSNIFIQINSTVKKQLQKKNNSPLPPLMTHESIGWLNTDKASGGCRNFF